MLKKLRTTVSVLLLALSAGFAGLLTRSLHSTDHLELLYVLAGRSRTTVSVVSVDGDILIGSWFLDVLLMIPDKVDYERLEMADDANSAIPAELWSYFVDQGGTWRRIPLWLLSSATALLALILRWNLRFSLKQLLLITTLYAVFLGLGVIY